jgi:alkylation response protein AidB-like acyl-CoA dehydrogenase
MRTTDAAAGPGDYRSQARAWLAEHFPGLTGDRPGEELASAKAFQAALYDAGYAGISWPADYGGQGLGQAEQQIFAEEAAGYDLPSRPFMVGIGMCGPTLVDLGTPAQRQRYIRPLLRGEEIWCQLFSEPGAGSDVASLQTRAVRDGAEWVLTGQKVWTSGAQYSDFGAVLARTDPGQPKHAGLTMFVLDMHQPGVTVRPLVDMTGSAPFNEVFLDQARVPADEVLGEVGGGWRAAVTMLSHERLSIGGMRLRRSAGVSYASLVARARRLGAAADPLVRDSLAGLYADERVLELFNARLRAQSAAGRPPGSRGSVAKLAGALVLHRAVETAGLLAGPAAVAWETGDPGAAQLATGIVSAPASSIAGGTNEIQRTIIGERVLGLPREPQADRGVPFRDLTVGTQKSDAGSVSAPAAGRQKESHGPAAD